MKVKAYILMTANLGCETEILIGLKKVHGLEEAFYIFGDYDILAEVNARTIDELNQTVSQIRKLRNVRSTVTMIKREL